ncbi:MAG TPA: cysteine synthase family protein, partial [Candidatus Acidoferrales bacterium]|nr:cysteine synthase family protein [Candidatus Acidoferrales bacterium]
MPADANRADRGAAFSRDGADAGAREIVPIGRARSVLDLVGNTPLLEIKRLTAGLLPRGVRVFAKLEGFNPGGSVKDRPAKNMIEVGIAEGKLKPGKVILDSTSGNTGIALAMIGATIGYPVELVMPSNVSRERKKIVEAYGAKIHYSDPMEGSDGAIRMCRALLAEHPERYFKPDQYNNEANALAHFNTTGPEIWRQTRGEVTHFVAAIGTGGTVMGTGRFLKSKNRAVQVVAVEPDDAMHGLEGLKHMASSIVPGIYHESELDDKIQVSTEDAYEMVYALGQSEGLLVGQSSGAAMVAVLKL